MYYFIYSENGDIVSKGTRNTPLDPDSENAIACSEDQFINHDKYMVDVKLKTHKVVSKDPSSILNLAKINKKQEIKTISLQQQNRPYTDNNGVNWDSGIDSVNTLFALANSTEQLGGINAIVYDYSNKSHSMTTTQIKELAASIMAEYVKIKDRKQKLYSAIDDITDSSDAGLNQLSNIKW